MGVNVSHSQRVKYVHAKEYEGVDGGQSDFDMNANSFWAKAHV